jgi:hypothetical protein
MLRVKNISKDKRLEIICERVNNLFSSNQDFWKEVLNHTDVFLMSNINGSMIHNFYFASNLVVSVDTFKSKWVFSKSNGYTKPSHPNLVFLNTRRFNRSEASIAATIIHETVHCLDNTLPDYHFGPGDNTYTPEKDACAPQWISNLAYKYLSGGIPSEITDSGL